MLSRDLLVFQRPLLTFARSSGERMALVAFCATAAILQSAAFDGGRSLLVAAAAISGALFAEFCVCAGQRGAAGKSGSKRRLKNIIASFDGSSFVSALILTLFLPNTINPAMAAIGTLFAVLVVKRSYGGLGSNWFNPALGGWLFVRFSWPLLFKNAMSASSLNFISNFSSEATALRAAAEVSPVAILTKNGFGTQNGEAMTNFLNNTVFKLINIEIPAAYFDFFIDPGAGLIADRGLLALIASSVIMVAAMVSRPALSAVYITVMLAAAKLAGALPFGGGIGAGDMLFCVFSGGTLAVALFVVVEPATGPKTKAGRFFYVVFAALLTAIFRYAKAEAYAALFAVTLMNVFAPVFRMIEERLCYEGGIKWL